MNINMDLPARIAVGLFWNCSGPISKRVVSVGNSFPRASFFHNSDIVLFQLEMMKCFPARTSIIQLLCDRIRKINIFALKKEKIRILYESYGLYSKLKKQKI